MSSAKERLENAMQQFNDSIARKEDVELAHEFAEEITESIRQEDLLKAFARANNNSLNLFLQQDNVQPVLDELGVLRSTGNIFRGLVIREFSVPRRGRKLGFNLILAYVSPPSSEDILQDAVKDFPGKENEIIVPERTEGLVMLKEVGHIGSKDQQGSTIVQRKIKIIRPSDFENAGLFETALDASITPDDIDTWVEERLLEFATKLEEASNAD